jgi:transposase
LEEDVRMDGNKRQLPVYTDEFRRDSAELVLSSGRPTKEVARELGINDTTLGNWVRAERKKRAGGAIGSPGSGASVEEENKRLRRRVSELEKEREILKRATAFWVKESNG